MKTTSKIFVSCLLCLALVFMNGCGNNNVGGLDSAFAQTRGATIVQWEYKFIDLSRNVESEFNQLGSEGWELVQTTVLAGDWTGHYFKRPKR